ncbi:hypothetical protein PV10_02920 [Exophiala mesophila]|uniref:Uncharacterized protein n=1 Tax=Exophiala mesophila TaxID=212818 RepID=A0A0D1X0F4_EXOME|nr:uncharacterized protein PV10_02920 [Exophiala mesophila]KIV95245.1 hypothetical protein PV10_02920 [Exophiala mesophila]
MPVYLLHGFRWHREGVSGIRVHAILHNLEDLSVEYIQNENSRAELLSSFHKAYPEIMKELDGKLEFIEQYNPEDLDGPNAVSQPYAYVGDKVVTLAANPGSMAFNISQPTNTTASPAGPNTVQGQPRPSTETPKTATGPKLPDTTSLSINVQEVIAAGPGLTNRAWEAMADLRDHLAKGENIGWWVIYNGDPEREVLDSDMDSESDDEAEEDLETEPVTQSSTTETPAGQQQQPPPQKQRDATPSQEALQAMTLRQKALGPGSPERVQPQHHQRYQQQAEQQRASILQQRQQHQRQESGSRSTLPTGAGTRPNPNTGEAQPSDNTTPISPRHPQVPPSPIAERHTAPQTKSSDPSSNFSPNLTALPTSNYVPPTPPEVATVPKGKSREKEPASVSKSQGFRKKLFGKRL